MLKHMVKLQQSDACRPHPDLSGQRRASSRGTEESRLCVVWARGSVRGLRTDCGVSKLNLSGNHGGTWRSRKFPGPHGRLSNEGGDRRGRGMGNEP